MGDIAQHPRVLCIRGCLVRLTGFEPAAFRVGAERSIQLSYNRTFMKIAARTNFII